jgi:ADP-glucose pyrophosphorylase
LPAEPESGSFRLPAIAPNRQCLSADTTASSTSPSPTASTPACARSYILTQYKALSLNRHIREGWTGIVAQELGEFFELMPPMQRTGANWYMGTADAVYQNIYSIGSEQPKYIIILSGDHIYKMDYSRMLAHHKEMNAEVTLATCPIPSGTRFRASAWSRWPERERFLGFQEKPLRPASGRRSIPTRWMPRWAFTSSTPRCC